MKAPAVRSAAERASAVFCRSSVSLAAVSLAEGGLLGLLGPDSSCM